MTATFEFEANEKIQDLNLELHFGLKQDNTNTYIKVIEDEDEFEAIAKIEELVGIFAMNGLEFQTYIN